MAKILIIDDDNQIRLMLKQVLEKAGHEVAEASDGKIGIRLHKENLYDLIITDIIMPDKEGIETIMELRRDMPKLKIIAISGGGRIPSGEYLKMAKSLGAHKTLAKPFERKEMLDAVKELLSEE